MSNTTKEKANRKAERQKRKAEEKRKRIIIIAVVAVVVVALLTFVIIKFGVPASRYQKANKLMTNGSWEAAAAIYEDLNYKDSEDMYYFCLGVRQYELGDYETAISYFEQSDYERAANWIEVLQNELG